MIDTASWEERTVDVINDVILDSTNVRIEGAEFSPQPDLIKILFGSHKAMELVESICKLGFLTHDVPVVVLESQAAKVVEGNRRFAALMAIQNPQLVPGVSRKIEQLADALTRDQRNSLRNVEVLVAPSQEEANQLVAAIHTGAKRVNWSPARQAAFFRGLIEEGRAFNEIRDLYPTIDIRPFFRTDTTLRLFAATAKQDQELAKKLARSSKITSTIERLISNPEFQDLASLRFDAESGVASVAGPQRQFDAVARQVIEDYDAKLINTQILNKQSDPDYKDYISKLKGISQRAAYEAQTDGTGKQPNNNGTSREPNSEELSNVDESESNSENAGTQRKYRSVSSILPLNGLSPIQNYPAVGVLFNEAVTINYQRFPHATGYLLRALLEKSIKAFADKYGQTANGNATECAKWLRRRAKKESNRTLEQALSSVISAMDDRDHSITIDGMNAITHNHTVLADGKSVLRFWQQLHAPLDYLRK